ncbi:MAG: hypothetical protein DI570_09935, partial [Phenylobacterium zucineum]
MSTVLLDKTGTHYGVFETAALPGPGKYRIDLKTSGTVWMELGAEWVNHWDVFLAPPPRAHGEYLDGNENDRSIYKTLPAKSASLTFFIPETTRTFGPAGENQYYG